MLTLAPDREQEAFIVEIQVAVQDMLAKEQMEIGMMSLKVLEEIALET